MIINTNRLSEALESILSNCINDCNTSYAAWKKVQPTEVQVAYKRLFNSSYCVIVELQKVITIPVLSVAQQLELDKIRVLHHTLNKINVDNDVVINHYTTSTPNKSTFDNLVWVNRNTGKIEERC